jgi:hypothetical protein
MQYIFAYAAALYSYLFRIISEIKIFNFRYLSSEHYIFTSARIRIYMANFRNKKESAGKILETVG